MSKVIRIDTNTEDLLNHWKKKYIPIYWDMEAKPNKEFFESDNHAIEFALNCAIYYADKYSKEEIENMKKIL